MATGGLLRQRDFRHLWAADVISKLGSGVSQLAIPLLAISTLDASAFEVSLLRVGQMIAYLVLGLQVGAWCDRLRVRPLLVVADLGRAVTLLSVPLAAVFGILTLWQLYAVVLVTGTLTVLFDIGHQSYLPRLVARENLVEGNAKLQVNVSVAAIAAPTLGGYLVQLCTAPVAILVDGLSYVWSAAWLRTIRATEPMPEQSERRVLRDGFRFVFGHPFLRVIACHGATLVLFQAVHIAIAVVFLVRDIGLSPGSIGLLGSVGLTGALLSAFATQSLATRFGTARTLWSAALICGAAFLLFPLTTPGWGLVCYAVATFVTSFGIVTLNIIEVSFQQTICPDHLLGRVNATMRFLVWGAIPVGSLLGGVLATLIGTRETLWIAAVGVFLSALWLVLSPLRRMRDLPAA
jgi:MFS family permease